MDYQDSMSEALLRNSGAVGECLRGQRYTGEKPEFYRAFLELLVTAKEQNRPLNTRTVRGADGTWKIVFELG